MSSGGVVSLAISCSRTFSLAFYKFHIERTVQQIPSDGLGAFGVNRACIRFTESGVDSDASPPKLQASSLPRWSTNS